MWEIKKNNKKFFSLYVKLTILLSFKTRFPKVDQRTGSKYLIHGTKRRKENQLRSLGQG